MKLSEKISDAAGKMSPRKLILICAVLALLIFILLYSFLSAMVGNKEEEQPKPQGKAVIEAATDIPAHTMITEEMVRATLVPDSLVPAGAVTDKKLVVGKPAGVTILSGDVITSRKLDASGAAGFRGLIPKGMRAVSFAVNDITGVAGFAKPGDKVDILLIGSQSDQDRVTSKMLLKDVLLLAINKTSMNPPTPKNEEKKDGKTDEAKKAAAQQMNGGTPSVATVALSPYDAAKLTASLQVGQIQLLLRPADQKSDTDSVAYYVIPLPKATPTYNAPPPQQGPQPAISISNAPVGNGIEIIRGTSVSRGN